MQQALQAGSIKSQRAKLGIISITAELVVVVILVLLVVDNVLVDDVIKDVFLFKFKLEFRFGGETELFELTLGVEVAEMDVIVVVTFVETFELVLEVVTEIEEDTADGDQGNFEPEPFEVDLKLELVVDENEVVLLVVVVIFVLASDAFD